MERRISADDLELTGGNELVVPATLKEVRENVERELVEQTLKRHAGKITSAAADLGISRPTLYELMEKLGIARTDKAQSLGSSDAEAATEPQEA